MKQYLIALSLAYGLTACEYEDGKDGVNGINGADGLSCEIVNDGELQCGEDVIAIRGEKGEPGEKGENGVSCRIETNQRGDFLICGDQSVQIPPETSEQGNCTSESLENGNHLITCDGDTIEVPGSESIPEIIKIAWTPVELVKSGVFVDAEVVTSILEFNVPVSLDETLLSEVRQGFTKSGPKTVQITSKIGESNYGDWTLHIDGSVFQNTYNIQSTASEDIELQILEYSYKENLETLLFSATPYTLCDTSFALVNLEEAKSLGRRDDPVLLNLLNRKAFDYKAGNVVTVDPSENVEVYCVR